MIELTDISMHVPLQLKAKIGRKFTDYFIELKLKLKHFLLCIPGTFNITEGKYLL